MIEAACEWRGNAASSTAPLPAAWGIGGVRIATFARGWVMTRNITVLTCRLAEMGARVVAVMIALNVAPGTLAGVPRRLPKPCIASRTPDGRTAELPVVANANPVQNRIVAETVAALAEVTAA
jgi:hypothetical protein